MSILTSCLAMVAVISMAVAATIEPGPGTFFVALNGNDEWSGRLPSPNGGGTDGPFLTLARAREAVRSADPDLDRRLVVRAGTHYLEEPLLLGPEDSGTEDHPVVWMAYPEEKVVLSGGRPIADWRKAEGGVWVASVPEVKAGEWSFRQLRVGDEMQTLARHPNAVPDEPYTGGWLFAKPQEMIGGWGLTVANIHTPGDWIEWETDVPADGEYSLWVRYGAKNEPFGRTDMAGRTTVQVDGGEDVPLQNLPDTAGWDRFEWSLCAALRLTEGKHTLRWTNRQGGGINFDALALCADPNWKPEGTELAEPAAGTHVIVRQAEVWTRAEGKEMTRAVRYATSKDFVPFGEGDIPDGWEVTGADIMVFPAWGWVGGPVEVGGIDREQNRLLLTGQNAQQEIRRGNRYYLRNVRQALDQPGEFYLDEEAGELLYTPKSEDFHRQEVVAPVHDRIIHVQGDDEADTWPEHIHFRGLAFRDTTYSRGVPSLYEDPDATIWLDHVRDCAIEDCTFSQLGGNAVNLCNNSTRCQILGCNIIDMGGGAVIMTGDTAGQSTDCVVAGCQMSFLGRIYKHVAGVYVTTGSGHRVAHNTITDVPRYAISFKSYNADSYSHNNIAEYNEMIRTNLETNDTGAIETLGRDRELTGNIIRYNLILDVVGMKHTEEGGIISPFYTWGIYLDDYSSGTHVYGNIVARTYRGGYHNHLGFQNVVENNIFVDGHLQQAEYNGRADMRDNVFGRNIVVYSNPEAAYIRSSGWDRAVLKECDQNVIWWAGGDLTATGAAITPEGSWAKWLEAGFDRNSVVDDPGFEDAAHDDYRLRPDSPALKLGFERISIERIGVKGYVGPE